MKEQQTSGREPDDLAGNAAERLVLWLYVTGATSRSARAISNIRRICDQYLAGNFDLRIVDIYIEPEVALAHQIVASPTLVKVSPAPVRRLIGDLSDEARTVALLGIKPHKALDET
jgi:circadian clock protein KaiB